MSHNCLNSLVVFCAEPKLFKNINNGIFEKFERQGARIKDNFLFKRINLKCMQYIVCIIVLYVNYKKLSLLKKYNCLQFV